MPIYLLRHEQRFLHNHTYQVTLTKTGLSNAISLADRISKLDITDIYCSPFMRAIQTVHPYSTRSNTKINIENSLLEYLERPDILPNKYKMVFSDPELEYWNINKSYTSFLSDDYVTNGIVETQEDVMYRAQSFLTYLRTICGDKNILLVSHKNTLRCIWNAMHDDNLSLEMGEIAKLCD